MRKIRTSLLAIALSALALGLVRGQAAYAQTPPLQNVQVWQSGSGNTQSIQFRVFDPSRGQWMQGNASYSSGFSQSWYVSDLTNQNGVVAWRATLQQRGAGYSWETRSTQVNYAVYDPSRGQWMQGNASYSSSFSQSWYISDLTNQNGVVAWRAILQQRRGYGWEVVRTVNRSVTYYFPLGRWVDSNDPAPVTRVPLYETYHAGTTDHFYTVNAGVRDAVVYYYGYSNQGAPFQVEGVQLPGTVPFRRFYRGWPQTDHIYLTDSDEINHVLSHGWVDEGVEGYIYTSQMPGTVPLYRLNKWNGQTDDHDHQYTTNLSTLQSLQYQGWGFDRVQGYVWPAN